jgi:GT2 family glycosyltransferase
VSSPGQDVNEALSALAARDAELGAEACDLFGAPLGSESRYDFPDFQPFTRFRHEFVPGPSRVRRLRTALGNRLHSRSEGASLGRPRSGRARVVETDGWMFFVSPGCSLHADAARLVAQSTASGHADLIYGDSVHYGGSDPGQSVHQLRPGWSPERLKAHCYVGEVLAARPELVDRAGGAKRLARCSSHDRALRLAESALGVARVPELLYASPHDQRMPSVDRAAVDAHCLRTGVEAAVDLSTDGSHVRVLRRSPARPSTAVIIPTRGTSVRAGDVERVLAVTAIETLLSNCGADIDEILVVFDEETPPAAREAILLAGGEKVRAVEYAGEFNFARKINNAAVRTGADLLLLLNDDVEIEMPDTIQVLGGYLEDPAIGLVAPILLFEDGTVQSAGHLLNPAPFDLYRGYPVGMPGGSEMLKVAREASSVIAAVALTRRADFIDVGGLCEDFPGDYNDVDYALKLAMNGKRTVITPYVSCRHLESKTRRAAPDGDAIDGLGARWRLIIENDPLGNPGLQRYEFIWKADVDTEWSLEEAVGRRVSWDREEWDRLRSAADPRLHRTRYFAHKVLGR